MDTLDMALNNAESDDLDKHLAALDSVTYWDRRIDAAIRGYLDCAMWTAIDFESESPLEDTYDGPGWSEQAWAEARETVRDFVTCNADILESAEPWRSDYSQVGHDLWLTRNHHGAGFWDRGAGDAGRKLTDMAEPYGSADVIVGDDGLLYIE